MDEVAEEVEKVQKKWEDGYAKAQQHLNAIQNYATKAASTASTTRSENSLVRLNALAHNSLAFLNSLHFKLNLLAPQLPDHHHIKSAHALLHSWHNHIHNLRLSLRNANLQAKANIRKTAQEERELLLGGGEESTICRRNLQTKAGMTSAAESITESLRCSRQLMVQVVSFALPCSANLYEESTGVLKKAESEYKGHSSLLMTRNLLSTMQHQDVLDRVKLIVGLVLFSCAVLYVVSKSIGVLKLQRQVTLAIKAGMAGQVGVESRACEDGLNLYDNAIPKVEVPLEQPMHDEL
ncbi:LOW QUALITY PROTEIN: Sec20 domain-containing protein, partial [Cephalotus follicularis]